MTVNINNTQSQEHREKKHTGSEKEIVLDWTKRLREQKKIEVSGLVRRNQQCISHNGYKVVLFCFSW